MTGLQITTEDAVIPRLDALVARLENPEPLLDVLGQTLLTGLVERFEAEEAPDGTPWKPSNRVRAGGGKTLQDTGALKDSLTYRVSGGELFIGTPFPWAVTHQEGRTITPVNAKALRFPVPGGVAFAKLVTVPARPMFGVSEADREDIDDALDAFFEAGLGPADGASQ